MRLWRASENKQDEQKTQDTQKTIGYSKGVLTGKKALFIVLLSVGFFWSFLACGYLAYRKFIHSRLQDPRFSICAIKQKAYSQDVLPCVFLAELLGLSQDKPTNLYAFSCTRAEQKLLHYPFFKTASVEKKVPGVVTISYELRRPIALIGDYENVAISEDKFLFPLLPFYSPKKLPEIILGDAVLRSIDPERVQLAFDVLAEAKHFPPQFFLTRVDVRSSCTKSKSREIVLVLEEARFEKDSECRAEYIVRLPRKEYKKMIARFFLMVDTIKKMQQKEGVLSSIVDLRVDHIALIKN